MTSYAIFPKRERVKSFARMSIGTIYSRNIPWYRFYGVIKHICCFINVANAQIDNKIKLQVNETRALNCFKRKT